MYELGLWTLARPQLMRMTGPNKMRNFFTNKPKNENKAILKICANYSHQTDRQ